MTSNYKISVAFGFLLLFVYTLIFISTNGGIIGLESVRVLGYFAIIQLVYTVLSWHSIKNTWLDAYLIFTAALYSFMLAQPMMEALEISVPFRRLWDGGFGITYSAYYQATYYSMLCCIFFHFGALLSTKKRLLTTKFNDLSLKPMKKFAIFIAIISFPFFIYSLSLQITVVQAFGYAALYDWEEYTSRFVMIMADFFIPSLLVLFCDSIIKDKHVKFYAALVVVLVFIPPFFLGGRSDAMISIAIFGVVYASVKRVKPKHIILAVATGVLMLYAMNIVGQIRSGNERSLEIVKSSISNNEDNPVYKTLEEMGWSMFPTIKTIEVVPKVYDYSYGGSYFWALVSVIPNVGFWEGVHPGKENDPGYKLGEYVNLGYGMGYSIVAGTYNEFGYLGFILMFIYGYYFSRIFMFISRRTIYERPVQFILAVLFLWFSLKFVRNSYDSMVRNVFFYIIPMYIIARLGSRYKKVSV